MATFEVVQHTFVEVLGRGLLLTLMEELLERLSCPRIQAVRTRGCQRRMVVVDLLAIRFLIKSLISILAKVFGGNHCNFFNLAPWIYVGSPSRLVLYSYLDR